jgi:hypothetical protein
MAHESDLAVLLQFVTLVDAESVYPKILISESCKVMPLLGNYRGLALEGEDTYYIV